MVSSRIPRRRFRTDVGESESDDSNAVSRKPIRRLHGNNEYTPMKPMGADEAPAESYQYVGCFKHDWDASSLEFAYHSKQMTTTVSKSNAQTTYEYRCV